MLVVEPSTLGQVAANGSSSSRASSQICLVIRNPRARGRNSNSVTSSQ